MAHTGLFTAPVPGTPPVGMSATDGRLVLGGVFGTTPQLVSGGAFTPSGSAMTGTVAQAVWQLPDVTNSAATFLSPTDLASLTFAAAPATGGRIDLVCVKQNNIENSDADSRVNVTVVTGIASGTPVAPATPAGAAVYLHVLISAGQTNLAAATVTNYMPTAYVASDIRCATLSGLTSFTGSTSQHATVTSDPTTSNNGDYVWSGTAWTPVTSTYTIGAFTPTGIYSNGTPTPQVIASNGRAYLEGLITSSSATFGGGTTYTLGSIPAAFAPLATRIFAVSVNTIILGSVIVQTSGTMQWIPNSGFTNTLSMNIDGPSWRLR